MWTSYLVECLPRDMVREFARHGWQVLELSDEHARNLPKAMRLASRPGFCAPAATLPFGHNKIYEN